MLILNVTDDLFKYIFNSYQANDTAVFIHHNSHVIATGPELLQEHVQTFALRNKHRRSQQTFPGQVMVTIFTKMAQQILGQ